ncbi:MAG: DNA polymerase III subunit delta [Coriobacteriales bacterium]|jgi:DNA polymerase-3 subunit delta|nr:DNA polymerase III subunit delta [Coriobacteriales bacterium]
MAASKKPLLALYLLNGDDSLKQEKLLARLRQRIADEGDLAMNSQTLSAKDIPDAAWLLSTLNTVPFGSPVRLVVVKEADALPKALQEALVGYAADPAPTTVLALVARKLSANTRLHKAVLAYDRQSLVDCSSKKAFELPALIRGMARGEGSDITVGAANLLVERIGTSTVALDTEVRKLAALTKAVGASRIEEGDVTRNVARLVEPKPWDLTDALARRDASLCLRLADRMGSASAIGLFVQCVTRLREVLTAMSLTQRGLPVAASMGKQEWQLREIMKATTRYRADELVALLCRAPEIEMRMKSGADADRLLRLWLIEACTQS